MKTCQHEGNKRGLFKQRRVLSKTWHEKREKYDKKCLRSSAHQGRFMTR
jgi:hypothetical protein